MHSLYTATGKEIEVFGVLYDEYAQVIHIMTKDMTLPEIVTLFSDETETSTMTYMDSTFEGFVVIRAISPTSETISVTMGKRR